MIRHLVLRLIGVLIVFPALAWQQGDIRQDRNGKPMMDGGGTLVVAGSGRWAGPGHCSVLQDKDGEKLVFHAYDRGWRGVPTLRIAPLRWDSEGWPE